MDQYENISKCLRDRDPTGFVWKYFPVKGMYLQADCGKHKTVWILIRAGFSLIRTYMGSLRSRV